MASVFLRGAQRVQLYQSATQINIDAIVVFKIGNATKQWMSAEPSVHIYLPPLPLYFHETGFLS